jgi:hypothetical protein
VDKVEERIGSFFEVKHKKSHLIRARKYKNVKLTRLKKEIIV